MSLSPPVVGAPGLWGEDVVHTGTTVQREGRDVTHPKSLLPW